MSRAVLLAAGAVVALLVAAPASAHSLLLASAPAANATVTSGPERIALRFNNRIETRLCRVRLCRRSSRAATGWSGRSSPPTATW